MEHQNPPHDVVALIDALRQNPNRQVLSIIIEVDRFGRRKYRHIRAEEIATVLNDLLQKTSCHS
jgi:hypothetical protein